MNAGLEAEPVENCKSELFLKFIFEICTRESPWNIQTMEKPFESVGFVYNEIQVDVCWYRNE